MGRATALFFCPAPWGPGEGPKGQISLNIFKFQLLSQFQRFLNQTLCLLTNERYKTYQMGFSFGHLGHAPGVGLGGTVGGLRVKKFFFPKFNQIWCVSYMNCTCTDTIFWVPAPWGPGEGPKGQISLNLIITKSFLKIFKPNFVYLLTNERYITYQMGFSFGRLGHAQGWDLGVPWGVGGVKTFFLKFNQIWCVSYLHELHMHRQNFFGLQPLGPWGGVKSLFFRTWLCGISN